jgi:hypothetical protein
MRHRATRQRQLFEEHKTVLPPQLPHDVLQQTTRLLTQWMAALAKSISAEVDNEQDQR